jgi:hypothetical protein
MKTLPLAVLVALALPATAIAKEPVKVTVCGAQGCNDSKDGQTIMALAEGGNPTGGAPSVAAPGYKVRVTFKEGGRQVGTFAVWHVPSLRLIRSEDGVWMEMKAAGLAALRQVAGDLHPFPAGAIPTASPSPGGALPPHTYKVADTPKAAPAAETGGGSGGTPWWLIAGIVAALAALGAGAMRLRHAPS